MHNNNQKTSGYAWLIWALASSIFLFEYFPRVAPGVMADQLMAHFQANAADLSRISVFFYIGYLVMQIPVGILIDNFSTRYLLASSTIICGLSAIGFAYSNLIIQAEIARLIMGLTAAFGFIGALKIAKLWFPANKIGLLAGGTQALGMLGAALGEGPVAHLTAAIGWQQTMVWIGAIVLLIGVAIAIIVRDKPQPKSLQTHSLLYSLKIVLKNPVSWLNALVIGTLYAPIAAFGELWGTSFVHTIYKIPQATAAGAMSFIFIGWAVGGPIAGAISDKIQQRRPVIIASCAFSLIFLCIVLYAPHLSITELYIVLFLFGLSNVGVAINCAVAIEANCAAVAGTSLAFANMASILIGALLQPIIGYLLVQETLTQRSIFIQALAFAMLCSPCQFVLE